MAQALVSAPSVLSPRTPTTSSSRAPLPGSSGAAFARLSGEVGLTPTSPTYLLNSKRPPSSSCHIRWLEVGVLAWTLWTVRNKLVIERIPLRRATDALYKFSGFLQLWRPLSRPLERDAISAFIADLRSMAVRLSPPPPPPEPD